MAFKKGHIPWSKGLKRPDWTGENNPRWKPKVVVNCKFCKKNFETWPSKIVWGVKYCSRNCQSKGKVKLGAEHHNWKGGIENHKRTDRRGDPAYQKWVREVKKRDGWKCRIADENCSGKVIAHHILVWRDFPELRYKINNGITLCHAHHPRMRAEEKRLAPILMELVSVSSEQTFETNKEN